MLRPLKMVVIAALITVAAGCVYRPAINQGNFLTSENVAKIKTGMTQQQVAYVLGTPMLEDTYNENVWRYIYRIWPAKEAVSQQTLTLRFNSQGRLTQIDNQEFGYNAEKKAKAAKEAKEQADKAAKKAAELADKAKEKATAEKAKLAK